MNKLDIENIEIDLFLEAIYRRYGYDFRNYARASINRRVRHLQEKTQSKSISQMTEKLLYDESFFSEIALGFSITVTEMFRDPTFYLSLRKNVIPFLKTFPYIKVWHAGCASGEEVYSLAILFKEEGLYERTTIYATDYNDMALEKAAKGVYAIDRIKSYSSNYIASGGMSSLSDYFYAEYDSVIMDSELRRNITFANHNLAIDGVFSEMHLILCRNVVIYFNKDLQERAYGLFEDSLVFGGFLCLGAKESIDFSQVRSHFADIDSSMRIFQKKSVNPALSYSNEDKL